MSDISIFCLGFICGTLLTGGFAMYEAHRQFKNFITKAEIDELKAKIQSLRR